MQPRDDMEAAGLALSHLTPDDRLLCLTMAVLADNCDSAIRPIATLISVAASMASVLSCEQRELIAEHLHREAEEIEAASDLGLQVRRNVLIRRARARLH